MRIILLIVLLFGLISAKSQIMTNNGNFVMLTGNGNEDVLIKSTKGDWQLSLPSSVSKMFSSDDKYLLFCKNDNLEVWKLESDSGSLWRTFSGIRSFSQGSGQSSNWLFCNPSKGADDLLLLNIKTRKKISIAGGKNYKLSEEGNSFSIIRQNKDSVELLWMSMKSEKPKVVWIGREELLLNHVIDKSGSQIAWLTESKGSDKIARIRFWSLRNNNVKLLVQDGMPFLDKELQILKKADKTAVRKTFTLKFNLSGDRLLFMLQEKIPPINKISKKVPEVWSYLDAKLYPHQQNALKVKKNFVSAINVSTGQLIKIEGENELVIDDFNHLPNKFMLLCSLRADLFNYNGTENPISGYTFYESSWNKLAGFCDIDIVSLTDGSRKRLNNNVRIESRLPKYIVSPSERFVLYFDINESNWFLIDLENGEVRNLTKEINTRWNGFISNTRLFFGLEPEGHGHYDIIWLPGERGLILQDGFSDFWQLDFQAKSSPLCISGRYAKEKGMKIQRIFLNNENQNFQSSQFLVSLHKRGTSSALVNKGFAKLRIGANASPELLIATEGAYDYNLLGLGYNQYLFSRAHASEPEEIVITDDFKHYQVLRNAKKLSKELIVQKELITWTTKNGEKAYGVLYKPKDFDSSRKYPVIITYYESTLGNLKMECYDRKYCRLPMGLSYLEEGYIVFLPEIRFTLGEIGPSVVDFVVSGAEKIAQLPYINGKKMGITGQSFGGYTTSYIVTHSNLFAAAVSIAGAGINFFSNFGTINKSHHLGAQDVSGLGAQLGVASSPWERPDLYLKNSPLFYANQVTTPILLSHSKGDFNIPFSQTVEFFIALRRCGKRVWLLTDDAEMHSGPGWGIKEFWAHYLKDAPAPKWMLEGIPAKLRGIENYRELDSTGKTPGPGLVIENKILTSPEQEKIQKNRTKVTNEGRIEDTKQ